MRDSCNIDWAKNPSQGHDRIPANGRMYVRADALRDVTSRSAQASQRGPKSGTGMQPQDLRHSNQVAEAHSSLGVSVIERRD